MRDLRLVGGFDVLFGKIKAFVETELFQQPVDLADLNVLRNLSEIEAVRTITEGLKTAINALTVQDKGATQIRDTIKLSKTRPHLVKDQAFLVPKRSVFNKVVADSGFELDVAAFLDGCADIVSFVKNSQSTQFRMEYRNADGSIANYYPDFLVKRTDSEIWVLWEFLTKETISAQPSKNAATSSSKPLSATTLLKTDRLGTRKAWSFTRCGRVLLSLIVSLI